MLPRTTRPPGLLHSLVCNHAFSDGNMRIGLLAADVFLRLNGAYIDESHDEEIFSIVLTVARLKPAACDF